jgi:hypothetical protein
MSYADWSFCYLTYNVFSFLWFILYRVSYRIHLSGTAVVLNDAFKVKHTYIEPLAPRVPTRAELIALHTEDIQVGVKYTHTYIHTHSHIHTQYTLFIIHHMHYYIQRIFRYAIGYTYNTYKKDRSHMCVMCCLAHIHTYTHTHTYTLTHTYIHTYIYTYTH